MADTTSTPGTPWFIPSSWPPSTRPPRGEWTGPVQVEEGYSVFRVSERIPEGVKPYERARNKARQLLLRAREAKELDRLVNSLREKYKAEVVVHEGNLRGALPDSLLAG